jgi:hypothetical protein
MFWNSGTHRKDKSGIGVRHPNVVGAGELSDGDRKTPFSPAVKGVVASAFPFQGEPWLTCTANHAEPRDTGSAKIP